MYFIADPESNKPIKYFGNLNDLDAYLKINHLEKINLNPFFENGEPIPILDGEALFVCYIRQMNIDSTEKVGNVTYLNEGVPNYFPLFKIPCGNGDEEL